MSSTVHIGSAAQFAQLLKSSTVVVADFYADWCGPCKQIAPVFESLSTKYSKPNRITFVKVDVDGQQGVAREYGVTAMPTFLIFSSGRVINTICGADRGALTSAVENAVRLASTAKPTYSYTATPGRALGSASSTAGGRGSWWNGSWSVSKVLHALYTFLGLYFISLFSLDPKGSAESSWFNVHRAPPVPQAVKIKPASAASRAAPPARKFGTLGDLTD